MSLLPSSPDTEADAEPRVIGVDSEEADEVLAALSAGTARELLQEIHDDPATPSALADRVDTSVQNAQYHLGKLESAGAIEVVDTAYSAKGREMDVYAPADQPLVVYAGEEETGSSLRAALSRLLGSVGLLAIASLVVQAVVSDLYPTREDGTGPVVAEDEPDDEPADDAAAPADDATEPGDEVAEPDDSPDIAVEEEMAEPSPEEVETAAEIATSLPPGLLFFLGGLFIIAVVAVVLWAR